MVQKQLQKRTGPLTVCAQNSAKPSQNAGVAATFDMVENALKAIDKRNDPTGKLKVKPIQTVRNKEMGGCYCRPHMRRKPPGKRKSKKYCKECGFKVRGKNHNEGTHHRNKVHPLKVA